MNAETELHPPEGCTGAVVVPAGDGRPYIQHDFETCPIHQRPARHTITCEATATIRERWAFTLPDDWATMDREEREEAISWAAPDGDCLGDEVLGDEQGREWDLDSIAPLEEATKTPDESGPVSVEGSYTAEQIAAGFDAARAIAAFLARPGDWVGGDVCEVAADELIKAGLLTKERCR